MTLEGTVRPSSSSSSYTQLMARPQFLPPQNISQVSKLPSGSRPKNITPCYKLENSTTNKCFKTKFKNRSGFTFHFSGHIQLHTTSLHQDARVIKAPSLWFPCGLCSSWGPISLLSEKRLPIRILPRLIFFSLQHLLRRSFFLFSLLIVKDISSHLTSEFRSLV